MEKVARQRSATWFLDHAVVVALAHYRLRDRGKFRIHPPHFVKDAELTARKKGSPVQPVPAAAFRRCASLRRSARPGLADPSRELRQQPSMQFGDSEPQSAVSTYPRRFGLLGGIPAAGGCAATRAPRFLEGA